MYLNTARNVHGVGMTVERVKRAGKGGGGYQLIRNSFQCSILMKHVFTSILLCFYVLENVYSMNGFSWSVGRIFSHSIKDVTSAPNGVTPPSVWRTFKASKSHHTLLGVTGMYGGGGNVRGVNFRILRKRF